MDCQFFVPAGILSYVDEANETQSLTITDLGIYIKPFCDSSMLPQIGDPTSSFYRQAPFYGSITPIAYTYSATAIMGWLLLLLLLISRKRRPWFQQIAALAVAVALLTRLVEVTVQLENQYNRGYQDVVELRQFIVDNTASNVLHFIALFVLYLAHIQILLILYGSRSKTTAILIRVVGGILVVLHSVFHGVSQFNRTAAVHTDFGARFHDPSYVLSVVSETLILVAYGAGVLYYSYTKRWYAYDVRNLSTAILSIGAVMSPIVFLALSTADFWFAGWAGATSAVCSTASIVVVWDWFDGIEWLELERHKSSVLGRPVSRSRRAFYNGDQNQGPGGNSMTHNVSEGDLSKRRRNLSTLVPTLQLNWTLRRPGSAFSEVSEPTGPARHIHPVKRSRMRESPVESSAPSEESTTSEPPPSHAPSNDPVSSPSYTFRVPRHPDQAVNRDTNPTNPTTEEADDLAPDDLPRFSPVPGFHPDDYFDEKA